MIRLDESPTVVTAGAAMFADALVAQLASPLRVQWAPPVPGSEGASRRDRRRSSHRRGHRGVGAAARLGPSAVGGRRLGP